jgi:hypothetical protein
MSPETDPHPLAANHAAVVSSTTEPKWWCGTLILAALLFAAILVNDAGTIFRSEYYETGDYAANSLQVRRAKRFQELLGNYSRFGFHHPGPAFFYTYALGEALFYDATHLVPTPFNAQLIALRALSAFFFSATVLLIARRLRGARRQWFLGLALLLAAWHFGSVGRFYNFFPGNPGFFCIWSPCVVVLPFLCFLVAAASVAAGAGRDLPLMVLAACFLAHGHVVMPLFILPLTLLAYGGLTYWTRIGRKLWPWRAFAGHHLVAGAIMVVFLLPIAIDALTAHPNNIQQILKHVGASAETRQGLLRSVLYFLHFAAYTPYPNHNSIPAFENFDWPGTFLFFRTHWRAYGLWLAVAGLTLGALRGIRTEIEIRRFVRAIAVVILAATLLSFFWGSIQEGTMFYFNSHFNFAIYYAGLLILVIAVAPWIDTKLAGVRGNRIAMVGPVVLALAVVAAFAQERRRFHSAPANQDQHRQFAASIEKALKIDPAQPKFINFDWAAGGEAVGLALYLERRGCAWMVREDWPLFFGRDKVVTAGRIDLPAPTASSSFWRVLSHPTASTIGPEQRLTVLPLMNDADLVFQTPAE